MKFIKLFLGILFVIVFISNSHAITVTQTGDASTLVNEILGSGVTVVGTPSYTGSNIAAGTFTDGLASGVGIDSGIILTSGNAADAVGPNNNGFVPETVGGLGATDDTSTDLGLPGDNDLTTLAGFPTFDATILEFDFETALEGDLTFKFVFASEEYIDFVNTEFNDVFAFFLDGVNIGVVPGTGYPITVNTINPITNNALYINNINPSTFDLEYDGFTIVITAQFMSLLPGQHSMKLAIADGSDGILDAAVFIEAGSFTFTEIEVPLDVKPQSCPNPLNFAAQGVLPVAILGTDDLDVTKVDPESVTLQGVHPIRWNYEDVATPFEPLMGKTGCEDCNELGPDGYMDLTLKFNKQEIVEILGTTLNDGDCVRLTLTGELKDEFDNIPIIGEDWIILRIKKGKK